jgi:hypothetical protein
MPLGKVYTNSLMSSLNSRKGWRYSSEASDSDDVVSDSGDDTKCTDLPQTSDKAGSEGAKTSTNIASRLRAQSINISHGAKEITVSDSQYTRILKIKKHYTAIIE